MFTTLRDARATLVPDPEGRHGPLPPLLLALTVVTGLVDAYSYLVLGHVFVANMTGNVVFMAFSLAGAPGFSLTASLLSLAAFAVGALFGGRLGHRSPHHRARFLLTATLVQTALVLTAFVMSRTVENPAGGWAKPVLIVLLALAMGLQNAAARRLAVPDLTTTVLTLTITGMAADGRLGGGPSAKAGPRLLSTAAMFCGALAGAALIMHGQRHTPLLVGSVLITAVAAVLLTQRRSARAWTA
ncbi:MULTISPECIES: YoaK family protein [unclassified Streptomyces]|uniref:YoaK family protein n=1 Tax=unclassified Streptomyces TaxID=2593676 RepID=UPI00324346AC